MSKFRDDYSFRHDEFEKNRKCANIAFWMIVVAWTLGILCMLVVLTAVVTIADQKIEQKGGVANSIGSFIHDVKESAK